MPRDRAVNANVDIATTDTNTGETDSALLLNLGIDGAIPLSDRKRRRLREFPPRWPRSSQSMPPPIQVLHSVDESFRKIPHVTKDIQQSRILIEALATKRPAELASAWRVAWQSGQRWRQKLEAGRARLPKETQASLLATAG